MSNTLWPQLKHHPTQAAYWRSQHRFNYLPCGRQSGKSELAYRKLVRHLPVPKPWSDPRYFLGYPTYRQAKKVGWQRMLNLIPSCWVGQNGISNSDLSIKTIFGSELFLVGLDKPHRIEGLIIDGGVIDENSDIRPGTFDLSILPTLIWRDGWTDFIGVPKRFGVGAEEYRTRCEKAKAGELPDSEVFSWASEGIVPTDYLELCRKTMDERDYEEQFNASWLSASGGIFHAFDREFNVRPSVYDPSLPLIVSSDFNVDPMAWIIAQEHGDVTNIIDELWMRNTNTPAAIAELLKRYGTHKAGFRMYGDASGKNRHTSASQSDFVHIASDPVLKGLGRTMHYTMSNPAVADRFAACNARICNGAGTRNLFVDPSCTHLVSDLETRSYKLGGREVDDLGDQGHITDALGYYIHSRFPLQLVIPNSNVVTISTGV
ncbi:hypothetical protein LCGC14_1248360 [marine sediment metagenome]|uniref:Terminase large subunit gp17-like C-terminal domain-containing protein n=1 Tax=marine sediment metagenome TaxID=412755 RepID=A0A0F9P7R4_9ZZZZ